MIAVRTGDESVTTDPDHADQDPAWDPSGQRILFACDRTGNLDLWAQDVDDAGNPVGAPLRLTTDSADDQMPSVSPTARRSPSPATGTPPAFPTRSSR